MPLESTGNTAIINTAFKGLDKKALDMMREFGVNKSYPPDTILCREGEDADAFFVITDGRVIISKEVEQGEDFVVGMLGTGGYFGELALIADNKRSATVRTLIKTEVIEITKEQFDRVFQASPAMARNLLETMVNVIRDTDRRAIQDLEARNEELARAYEELEAAQQDRIARAALEAQLEVAGVAQRSMLPTDLPHAPGYQFAAMFEPARHVGGDFYDVRTLPDGRIAMVIADVSDKGAHASLFMAVARTLFLTEENHYSEPSQVVEAVHNGLIAASDYDMFVTAVYGVLEPDTGIFRYVRAGHEEPILVRSNGEAALCSGGGRFLGLWDSAPKLEEIEIQLEAGDILLLYSDGVTDMRNHKDQPFGHKRMMQMVKHIRHYDAERIAHSIFSNVQQHRSAADAFDDFTLLVLRVDS